MFHDNLVQNSLINKHITFSLVNPLLKLLLAATTLLKACFSVMNAVKKKVYTKMGNRFKSDTLICCVEKTIFCTNYINVLFDFFKITEIEMGHLKM